MLHRAEPVTDFMPNQEIIAFHLPQLLDKHISRYSREGAVQGTEPARTLCQALEKHSSVLR